MKSKIFRYLPRSDAFCPAAGTRWISKLQGLNVKWGRGATQQGDTKAVPGDLLAGLLGRILSFYPAGQHAIAPVLRLSPLMPNLVLGAKFKGKRVKRAVDWDAL